PDAGGDGVDDRDDDERGGQLSDYRQRRGERQLHDRLRERHADGDPGGADRDGDQPDESLRRGESDLDGELQRVRQWRHGGEPDHRTERRDDGDGGERGGDV